MPTAPSRVRALHVLTLALFSSITATGCGGGDPALDPATRFSVSAASPALHAGELSATREPDVRTEFRPPDGISARPYCLVRFARLRHANGGGDYTLGLAFTPADARVLVVTLAQREGSWWVAAFSAPAAEARVDVTARRVVLNGLRSTQGLEVGWQATLNGGGSFPPAADTAACG